MDTSLLDTFGLVAAVGSLVTLVMVARGWRSFVRPVLGDRDKQLAEAAAYFLITPLVVLAHELGHVVATWSVGGAVVDFHYRFFWGSVTPAGAFSPADGWWIALAGNVVSAGGGLALVAASVAARRLPPAVRLTLLDGGRFQLLFTLVAYPVLSFGGLFGDWMTIYDFGDTPVLSAVTAVAHAAVLGVWAWRLRDRVGDVRLGLVSGEAGPLGHLRRAAASRPESVDAHLALAEFLVAHGDVALAERALRRGLRAVGPDPRLLLDLGRLALARDRVGEAATWLRRGLDASPAGPGAGATAATGPGPGAGATDTEQQLWANLALALTRMQRPEEAMAAFDRLATPLADDPVVTHWRGQARLQLERRQA